MTTATTEIKQGERFEFGRNWGRFLSLLDEDRILEAERSLSQRLELESLVGKSFLDIGSGSGLFSLAARRLGARVHSFDYDPESVACTMELKRRFFPSDTSWRVEQGSVLDKAYLMGLGKFDVVYSWGVLHHTGKMWQALGNVAPLVADDGKLFVAIYNDQGYASQVWLVIKRFYNRCPQIIKFGMLVVIGTFFQVKSAVGRLIRRENPLPFRYWREYKRRRGMSVWHDLVDWVGGYPFEVAKPEEIFDFYRERGFALTKLKTCGVGLGCNEYVFGKAPANESRR